MPRSGTVKRALVRHLVKIVRADVDPVRNPFGLVLNCFDSAPKRITAPTPEPPSRGGLVTQGEIP
ncbi:MULTISPECIES: TIGR03746 family integrating conjugative element protein [Pantoea]|uniref:TIGR03746 family integrating conjugative element protein n=1 Tax=Pantoea TaxID=53335 RepID=UPI00222128C5|nr:TIGR03746 family integrating conjugative element protein [Pantoea sp. JV6]MCW0973186.1 TIGR03746 family integrating conjugative element protein [Pantoea sp. JV6]